MVDDGEEFNNEGLPLEDGKVKPLSVTGRIPKGNCCNPIDRSSSGIKLTGASTNTLKAAYDGVANTCDDFLYNFAKANAATKPAQLNFMKVFGLPEERVPDNTFDDLVAHFANPANGEPDRKLVLRTFRKAVTELEKRLDILNFHIQVLEASNDPLAENYRTQLKAFSKNAKNFYENILKPHRYYYGVFTKVPLSEGTVETLEKNMVQKAREFRTELRTMNDEFNVEYNGNGHVRKLIQTIRGLSGEDASPVQSLRKSLRISRKIMVHLNREILEKELHNNEEFSQVYERAANLLFRANDSRSVRCLALWALKRRIVKQTVFAELYWSEPIPE